MRFSSASPLHAPRNVRGTPWAVDLSFDTNRERSRPMPSIIRWAKRVAQALGVLLAVAVGAVYARSSWILSRRWDIAPSNVVVPSDASAIERGERLATTRGCRGCHGLRLQGDVIADIPFAVRLVAPNIAALARTYSNVDLERSIRHGVKPSGASVQLMLSDMFFNLSDADVGAIIAYL